MSNPAKLIRDISDTALWAAMYRAREHDRPDGLFRDPFALPLAGERGQQIFEAVPEKDRNEWAWVMRTYLFDAYIAERIAVGCDCVVNLAAGLDARPYRMTLPAGLQWYEVDLPDIFAYKEEMLADEQPACKLQRIALDLADVDRRRDVFARLGGPAHRALILTEGLLAYLTDEEVGRLATDLAAAAGFSHWVLDVASPGLLRMMQGQSSYEMLAGAKSPLKFAPAAGPPFFEQFGWRVADVRSVLKTAAGLKRVPLWMRLLALLPESKGGQGSRPWSGVCLLANESV